LFLNFGAVLTTKHRRAESSVRFVLAFKGIVRGIGLLAADFAR